MATAPKTLFGKRLRQARERAGISQEKLGTLIGLDEGTSSARISRYETGTHAPLFEVAQLMAKALDLPVAYFYCDDELLAELVVTFMNWDAERQQALMESIRVDEELGSE